MTWIYWFVFIIPSQRWNQPGLPSPKPDIFRVLEFLNKVADLAPRNVLHRWTEPTKLSQLAHASCFSFNWAVRSCFFKGGLTILSASNKCLSTVLSLMWRSPWSIFSWAVVFWDLTCWHSRYFFHLFATFSFFSTSSNSLWWCTACHIFGY